MTLDQIIKDLDLKVITEEKDFSAGYANTWVCFGYAQLRYDRRKK